MNLVVFLAGIADTKWPLSKFLVEPLAMRSANRLALSPFDEAALEVALKIREGNAATKITVAMTGGPESDALLRKVAAFKVDRLLRLEASTLAPFDAQALAPRLKTALQEFAPSPGLILIGREFGDYDNGVLPPCLAAALGVPFFGLAQHAVWEGKELKFFREQGAIEESLALAGPMVVSVTNDRRNRLRHPLMKNVMETKRMTFNEVTPGRNGELRVSLVAVGEMPQRSRAGDCHILSGAMESQIAELADILKPWSARS